MGGEEVVQWRKRIYFTENYISVFPLLLLRPPGFFSLDYHVVSLTKKNMGKAKPRGERVERDQMKKKEKKKKQPVLLLFIPGSFSFLRYLDSNE